MTTRKAITGWLKDANQIPGVKLVQQLASEHDRLREALKDLEAIASLVSGLQTLHGNVSPEKWYSLAVNTEHARAVLAETEAK